jgi:hydrogenase maturation protein HypF
MTTVAACRVSVHGIVQGVGFRPFVYGLARRLGLGGLVRNTTRGVEIELEGDPDAIGEFLERLVAEAPPLAHIDDVRVHDAESRGRRGFTIRASREGAGFLPISPDVATCPACLAEILDPGDRRFGYPFTNCTRCGPRFTIIQAIPYDRPNTTMAGFTMCPECRAEYDDPADRRFHAQPNACAVCGPRLVLVNAQGVSLDADALTGTGRLLAAGHVVAIKGVGGFHLACDASSDAAVRRLRERKGREAKPLAVMVPDLSAVRRLCTASDAELALLGSPARPIAILAARPGADIAPSVAPGLRHLGLMLPYAPLHHLLFRGREECPRALVLTSGNRSEEPIATDNAEALARLGTIADAFLLHDRPIQTPCDDSVIRVVAGAELPVRRARGYAPLPVRLPFETPPILACGAELKATICLARGSYAFLSPHIGDLGNHETWVAYRDMVERMMRLFRIRPEAVAHDLHPDYLSTRFAAGLDADVPRIAVQHHHAHVAACMAEHRLTGPLIGVAFDGTGYGPDGAVWGGEFLVADYAGFERVGHLGYVPMPGGERAVREPFRMALAHLLRAAGEWDPGCHAVREATEPERRMIRWQLQHEVNAPLTSSMGRFFDAVASILGVRHRARYEGQAAMELEALVDATADAAPYPLVISDGAPLVIDPGPVIGAVAHDVASGVPVPRVAARFHVTVAESVVRVCARVRASTGLGRVVLSGGVFQNATLLDAARRGLGEAGFDVFSHHLVPPNDGGIALGQAVVAHAWLESR